MKLLHAVVVKPVLVIMCAILLEATGAPVANTIAWGALQVKTVASQVALPTWANPDQVERITQPVQVIVERTVAWVGEWAGNLK